MSDILAEIVARKRADLKTVTAERPFAEIDGLARAMPAPRGFAAAAPAAAIICAPRLRMSSRRVNDGRRKWIRRRALKFRSAGLASLAEERAKTRMAGQRSRKAV